MMARAWAFSSSVASFFSPVASVFCTSARTWRATRLSSALSDARPSSSTIATSTWVRLSDVSIGPSLSTVSMSRRERSAASRWAIWSRSR